MSEWAADEAERRFGLAPGSFPFASRFVDVAGHRVHYVDEGQGPTLFMLHGNPTWSYVYRHLIADLRRDYRCVAMDLPGFGLSEAAAGYGFRPDEHTLVVAEVLRRLDIADATLVAHDWGGPIGIGAMGQASGRITRLALGNTWAWPVNGDLHFEWFSKLLGGPLGRWAAMRHAIFVNMLMPSTMKRRSLSDEEMKAYRAPFADRARRVPMHVFPAQITGAGPWLATIEATARQFRGPMHLLWPSEDIAFRARELARWKRLCPQATVTHIERCGHFLWEDASDECVAALRSFLVTRRGAEPIAA